MLFNTEKDKLVVGLKQSVKAMSSGLVKSIYIANNTDPAIVSDLEKTATDNNIQIVYIDTMKELGAMCGINVGASCAVVIK